VHHPALKVLTMLIQHQPVVRQQIIAMELVETGRIDMLMVDMRKQEATVVILAIIP
jgi:hypothetical protein